MELHVSGISKKYGEEWVFRNLNITISSGTRLSVLGANGSGKSTLAKIIAGMLTPTEGQILYFQQDKELASGIIYKYISFSAPYMELIDELSVKEMYRFYLGIKNPAMPISAEECCAKTQLQDHAHKKTGALSSGNRQRIKLGLALLSASPLILLDEPVTNLDNEGISLYHRMIQELPVKSTLMVFSNHHQEEYEFCTSSLNLDTA